ncbi:MAG: NAD+ synthase [Candidatus Omnitrophica bacterium]|nr:NAD+ synthase [Candidatus Omnitrophota bacterium]
MNKMKSREMSRKLISFIKKTVASKGFSRVILGLSGGLDSSIVAFLSVKALGKDNVIGVLMPYGRFSKKSVADAKKIARILKISTTEHVDISPMVNAYFKKEKSTCHIRRGNKMARERMSILYDLSKKHNALVIGTSNKTEALLGYGTLHGDCAWALNPIGNLYKTQLRSLAKDIGIPSFVINKPPTAGLWDGQTDEDELGYTYDDIDKLLFLIIDKRLDNKELVKKGFDKEFISDIRIRIKNNKFKLQPPMVAKI